MYGRVNVQGAESYHSLFEISMAGYFSILVPKVRAKSGLSRD